MKLLLPLAVSVLLLTSCSRDNTVTKRSADRGERARIADGGSAVAYLKNAQGDVLGRATLTETKEGVRIAGEASSLPPGEHGFHVHETGVCEGPGFKSAGGHFNPSDNAHGGDNGADRHVGDLGNIHVGVDGRAVFDVTAYRATLHDSPTSLFHPGGTALVIHAKEDDLKTDPAGNSGDRLACAVVQRQ